MAAYSNRPGADGSLAISNGADQLAGQLESMSLASNGKLENIVGTFTSGVKHRRLTYLKDTTLIEMRPALEATDLLKFLLISRESITHCKVAGNTLEITDHDDGATRFTISGALQLPVTVDTSDGNVGVVKRFDGRNYRLDITQANFINIHEFGVHRQMTGYQITCDDLEDEKVATIYVMSGQMTIAFQSDISTRAKALVIAFGINRAISEHKATVVDQKQDKSVYDAAYYRLYESVFPLMESCVLRAAASTQYQNESIHVLMDAKDENKIQMFVKYEPNGNRTVAHDVCGNELFEIHFYSQLDNNYFVFQDGRKVGTFEPITSIIGDRTIIIPEFDGVETGVRKEFWCQYDDYNKCNTRYIFKDKEHNIVGTVENIVFTNQKYSTTNITLEKGECTQTKILLLAAALTISSLLNQFDNIVLPRAIFCRPETSHAYSTVKYCPMHLPVTSNAMTASCKLHIRAAGYHKPSGRQFYDVIEARNAMVVLSLEYKPNVGGRGGDLIAKEIGGLTIFVVADLLEDDLFIVQQRHGMAGYHRNSKFYFSFDSDEEMEIVGQKLPRENEDILGPDWQYQFSKQRKVLATLTSIDHVLVLNIEENDIVSLTMRYLMIAMAMRLNYQVYELHLRPIPQIQYTHLYNDHERAI